MKLPSLLLLTCLVLQSAHEAGSHQATGVKVGEVSETSAIVSVRLTANEVRRAGGIVVEGIPGEGKPFSAPPTFRLGGPKSDTLLFPPFLNPSQTLVQNPHLQPQPPQFTLPQTPNLHLRTGYHVPCLTGSQIQLP
ncbi:MAG: hypothetical protein GHCLOJNM_04274 [bacterium]|nr:hypothetical protein [bacterium]